MTRKFVGWLLVGVGAGCGLTFLGLVAFYTQTQPRSPSPEIGQVIPMNDHGTVVFLSSFQNFWLTFLLIATPLVLVVAGLVLSPMTWDRSKD